MLGITSRDEKYLLALEALYIRERKPSINTKDEYRRRELKISAYYMRESMSCSVVTNNGKRINSRSFVYMGSNSDL